MASPWDLAERATIAAHEAQQQLDDAWSVYRSLARSLNEIGHRARQAHSSGRYDLGLHNQYHALLPEIEAQMHVLEQAMIDVEKAETTRRAAYLAAIAATS